MASALVEPAMPPMMRRDHSDLGVLLNLRLGEHGVRNEWIVLCRDDKSRYSDLIEHVSRASPIVIVGAVSIAAVSGSIAVIEFADGGDVAKHGEIPFPRE